MSDINLTLEALFRPEDTFELRILHKQDGERWTHSGYYKREHAMEVAKQALKYNRMGDQVYVTINPVGAEVPIGNFIEKATRTTTDAMIKERRWLPLDFDPVREAGTSATTDQLQQAGQLANEVRVFLEAQGWPAPIQAESGNGIHLLYPVELPADDGGLCRSVLQALSDKFSTPDVQLDRSLGNASRIIKLYGTISQKGEQKRKTAITFLDDRNLVVSEADLRILVPHREEAIQTAREGQFGDFDLEAFLERAGLTVQRRGKLDDGRTRYILDHCYFNPAHVGSEVAIFKSADGKLGYKCFHNSCADHDWEALRNAVDGTPTERALKMFGQTEPLQIVDDDLKRLPPVSSINRTEMGNAERIAALAGGRLLYIEQTDTWVKFDAEQGWVVDNKEPMRLAIQAAKHIMVQATDLSQDDAVRAAVWYKTSLAKRALDAAVKLATLVMSADITEFDDEDHLLGTLNGVVDLRSGQFRPYKPEDRILRKCNVIYDGNAQCPKWESTVYEIMQGHGDMVKFMQDAFGYSLTGSTSAQKLMFAYGCGANGKSTMLNVLREIAGSYASVAQTDIFMDGNKGGGASPELAALAGARVVIAQETEEGATFKGALIKQLSGGDAVTARHLYGKPFTFVPKFQVWLSGNHKPNVIGSDNGTWRRMALIPFLQQFSIERQDKHLDRKLREEYSGILNWMIEGAVRFYSSGRLNIPSQIEAAVTEYRTDMDVLGQWIGDCCEETPEERTMLLDMYHSYKYWAKERGYREMSLKSFSNKLSERNIQSSKSKKGKVVLGYKLAADGFSSDFK